MYRLKNKHNVFDDEYNFLNSEQQYNIRLAYKHQFKYHI